MISSTQSVRKVQTIDEVLSSALRFLRLHFKPLGGGILKLVLPIWLAESFLTYVLFDSPDAEAHTTLAYFQILFRFVSAVVVQTAVTSYLVLYNDDPTRPIPIGELWHNVRFFLGRAFVAFLLYAILSIVGLVFFVLPGVYFIIAGAFAVVSVVQEDCSPFAAISRSTVLTQGYWWPTFGLFLLICFLQLILNVIADIPNVLIVPFYAATSGIPITIGVLLVLLNLFSNAVLFVGILITSLVLAFQYYNLVERKEAHGLLGRLAAMEGGTEGDALLDADAPEAEEPASPQE